MKSITAIIFCFILSSSKLFAQNAQWVKVYKRPNTPLVYEVPSPITYTDGISVVNAGEFESSIQIGGYTFISNADTTTANIAPVNGYIAKYDLSGNVLWAKHISGGSIKNLHVHIDGNQNIIVTGYSWSTATIDGLPIPNSNSRFFIAKFNASGSLLWYKTPNTHGVTNSGIGTDMFGNIYLSGFYNSTLQLDNHSINVAHNDTGLYSCKLQPNGMAVWLNNVPFISGVTPILTKIVVTATGSTYLAHKHTTNNSYNFSLRKFDSSGTQAWVREIVSANSTYSLIELGLDNRDNVYVTGDYYSTLTFGNLTVSYSNSWPHVGKYFIAKINSTGIWQWAKEIPGNYQSQYGGSLPKVSLININPNQFAVSGYASGSFYVGSSIKSINNGAFIAYLDSSGVVVKVNRINNVLGTKMSADGNGNTYVTGIFSKTLTIGSQTFNSLPINSDSFFFTKLLENANAATGKLFIDSNSNGLQDFGDLPFKNGLIAVSPGQNYNATASNGTYNFYVPAGNFNLQVLQPANHYTFLPQTHTVSFTGLGQTQTKDFALVPIPNRNDVKISITSITPARPGFLSKYRLTFDNVGTTTLSDSISLSFDASHLTFTTASITPATQKSGKLNWFYSGLQPTEKRDIDVEFNVSAATPINTNLNFVSAIKPISSDFIPDNNYDSLNQIVNGSFDPNDKLVNFASLTHSEITAGNKLLDYVIRFQNTGTDTAFTVVVKDSISNKLTMETFELLSASHPYTFRLIENGMMEWRFDNILLPDSNRNEPASHGFIRYRIKPKTNLVLGDEIKARAGIYFDYNAPVMTNYALTRIQNPTGIIEKNIGLTTFHLYPNPARDFLMAEAELNSEMPVSLKLTNLLGQHVFEKHYAKSKKMQAKLETGNLTKGVYLLSLQTEKGVVTKRLVIQ